MTDGRDVSRLPRWNIFGSRLILIMEVINVWLVG